MVRVSINPHRKQETNHRKSITRKLIGNESKSEIQGPLQETEKAELEEKKQDKGQREIIKTLHPRVDYFSSTSLDKSALE